MATQGFSTIDSIVRNECLAQEDYNLSNYMRYLSFAKEGLKDWSLDKKSDIKVVVDVTSNIATLPFPSDYVQWSRIGTVEGDRVKTMIENNKLALVQSLNDQGQPINNSPYQPNFQTPMAGGVSGILGSAYYSYTLNYDNSGAIYGFGNGGYLNDGQFRVDSANRRFQFSSDWASKTIYLEYVGTGLNATGQTVVDENASKAIKLYIRWQALEVSKTASLGEKARAEQKYWDENLTATKRLVVNLDKILGIAREGYKTTPKM
jgi:hypothetical protein